MTTRTQLLDHARAEPSQPRKLSSTVRAPRAYAESLRLYRKGSKEVKQIVGFLLGGRHLCTYIDKNGKRRKSKERYFHITTPLDEHWAVKEDYYYDSTAGFDVVVFVCFKCESNGVLLFSKEGYRDKPTKLKAPELLALIEDEEVPLSPERRRAWKQVLESKVFAPRPSVKGKAKFFNVWIPDIEDPSFLFKEDVPQWFDEYGEIIQGREFWFRLWHDKRRLRKPSERRCKLLHAMASYIREGWRLSAAMSTTGLPAAVEASNGHLAEKFGVSDESIRTGMLDLEEYGYIRRAGQVPSVTGKAHFVYLPGSGKLNTADSIRHRRPDEYPRPAMQMRHYREDHGILTEEEGLRLEEEEWATARAAEPPINYYDEQYAKRHNAKLNRLCEGSVLQSQI